MILNRALARLWRRWLLTVGIVEDGFIQVDRIAVLVRGLQLLVLHILIDV